MCGTGPRPEEGAEGRRSVQRVVFNAITKSAVHRRRSPIRATSTSRWSTPIWRAARSTIWSASPCRPCCGASCRARRSAGRVQSVALRLICEREAEIEAFRAPANTGPSTPSSHAARAALSARLTHLNGKKLDKFDIPTEAAAPRRQDADREAAQLHRRQRSSQARPAAIRRRRSSPPRCSRRPRASWASAPPTPCSIASACMKASTSAARLSA